MIFYQTLDQANANPEIGKRLYFYSHGDKTLFAWSKTGNAVSTGFVAFKKFGCQYGLVEGRKQHSRIVELQEENERLRAELAALKNGSAPADAG